jgi:small-conductance mechanosensitive channel
VWQALAGIATVVLGAALLANIFGFVSLSHLLGIGTLVGTFLAIILYCVVQVLLLLLALFLSSRWVSSLSAAQRESIERWARRGLIVAAALIWWRRSELNILFFHDTLTSLKSVVLAYSLSLGKMTITVGAVIGVLLILGIGFGVARAASSLLRSVLSASPSIDRGLPYAVSKVTYYCLMLLVLAAALLSAGVDLDRFTLITGALGLGVGFGLQNIVSNFASGLILLFERPIRLGDTVEINGQIGVVKRIGARSSSLSTPQGAELIVPNSDLLSNHVINWSLSSRGRRIEIPVRVAYGSDPETVIKLLTQAALAQPNVLRTPAPQGLVIGFGESALNFELHVWCARQDMWIQLKSEVVNGVHRALAEAGIKIPFPQRDLHLHGLDSDGT